jgi:RNA polymerase sigma-70 factor (ECF subfamily)
MRDSRLRATIRDPAAFRVRRSKMPSSPKSPASAPGAEALLAQQDFVRSLVRSLLGHDDDADDVVQATWLRALRHPLPALGGVRPWLARIARNLVRDRSRDARRREAREQTAARAEALPSTFDVLAREAERQRVVAAVLALPDPYRSVVLARYWEDVPAARLAARLGVPDATVRSQLRRGLAMLRERLDEGDGGRWSP